MGTPSRFPCREGVVLAAAFEKAWGLGVWSLDGVCVPAFRSARIVRPLRLSHAVAALAFVLSGWGARAAPQDAQGSVQMWVTTADRSSLLARGPDIVLSEAPQAAEITIDDTRRYQKIVGFGAALTDASAWLIENRMSPAQRAALLADLFGPAPGLKLSFTRLTIGASDFSQHEYSFDDVAKGQRDPGLSHFSIAPARAAVLPVLKRMLALNPDLKVMASPWSAPAWMKTSHSMIGGTLARRDYGVFARYLVRYAEAFAAEGVPIYALTVQNEPNFTPKNYPGMHMTARQRARLVGDYLGPLLAKRSEAPKVLDWDHNWDVPQSPLAVLADPKASRYVAGVAWHCYAGDVSVQGRVHDAYPAKETWLTECSGGGWSPESDALIWMAKNLMVRGTRQWARGVLLWNLALDENAGPHFGGCENCRGVVTIDSNSGAVTRNAEYYVLAHASRFVRPGAVRIDSGASPEGLSQVAFRNADDGSRVLIVVNSGAEPRLLAVKDGGRGFSATVPPMALATFVWPDPALPASGAPSVPQ